MAFNLSDLDSQTQEAILYIANQVSIHLSESAEKVIDVLPLGPIVQGQNGGYELDIQTIRVPKEIISEPANKFDDGNGNYVINRIHISKESISDVINADNNNRLYNNPFWEQTTLPVILLNYFETPKTENRIPFWRYVNPQN